MASNGSKYNLTGTVKDTSGFNSKDITPKTVTTTEVNTKRLNVEEEAVINDISANSISTSQLIVNGLFQTTGRSIINIRGLTSINNTVHVLTMEQFEAELVNAAITGGTSIVVAPGEFIVSSPLVIPADTDIRGSGINTTIFKARSGFTTAAPMFSMNGNNSSISDCQFNGNGGEVGLLRVSSVDFIFIDKVIFINTLGTMLELNNATRINVSNILFRNKPTSAHSALFIRGNTNDCIFNSMFFIEINQNTIAGSGCVIDINTFTGDITSNDVFNLIFSNIQVSNSILSGNPNSKAIALWARTGSITQVQFLNIIISNVSLIGNGNIIELRAATNTILRNISFDSVDVNTISIVSASLASIFHFGPSGSGTISHVQIKSIKISNIDNTIERIISADASVSNVIIDALTFSREISNIICYAIRFGEGGENLNFINIVVENCSMFSFEDYTFVNISNASFTGEIENAPIINCVNSSNIFISNSFFNRTVISDSLIRTCISIINSNTVIIQGIKITNISVGINANAVTFLVVVFSEFDTSLLFSSLATTAINISTGGILASSPSQYITNITNNVFRGYSSATNAITRCVDILIPPGVATMQDSDILITNNASDNIISPFRIYTTPISALNFYSKCYINVSNNILTRHRDGIFIGILSSLDMVGNTIHRPRTGTSSGITVNFTLAFEGNSALNILYKNVCISNNIITRGTFSGVDHTTALFVAVGIRGNGVISNNYIEGSGGTIPMSLQDFENGAILGNRSINGVSNTFTFGTTIISDVTNLNTTSGPITVTLSNIGAPRAGFVATFFFQVRPGTNDVTINVTSPGVDFKTLTVYTTNVVLNALNRFVIFEWNGERWDIRSYSTGVVVT
jgi:hypothetical protein